MGGAGVGTTVAAGGRTIGRRRIDLSHWADQRRDEILYSTRASDRSALPAMTPAGFPFGAFGRTVHPYGTHTPLPAPRQAGVRPDGDRTAIHHGEP